MKRLARLKDLVAGDSDRGAFVRGTAWLAGGTAAAQAVVVLTGPVISRLFDQADVAALATFATLLSFLAPIACLRYESALSLPEDEQHASELLVVCLVSTLLVSLAAFVAVMLSRDLLAAAFKQPGLVRLLPFVPLSLAGVGVYQAFNYWAVRHRLYQVTARTKLSQGLTGTAAQIVAGVLNWGGPGLVFGEVLGRVAGSGTIATLAWKRSGEKIRSVTREGALAMARRYSSFPKFGGPAALIHTATTAIPLLLTVVYTPQVWGAYFFGIRFVWAPVSLVGQAMAQVFVGEASRLSREDPARLRAAFRSIVRRLMVLGSVPFAILTFAGGPLVALVFGEPWRTAGEYVQVQAPSWFAMFVVGPVLPALAILERQRWQLWIDGAGLAVMAAGLWMARTYGWPALFSVGFYSVAITLMYGALLYACRQAISRHQPNAAEGRDRG
ncbi:MAG: oligosaccharide flippase family protein [Fimbriimonadaceae bacterium]|nr:oligosaccharide flippase family protein [Fimbriimonadaceae bacterium]QYK56097.1 MAG: oligosaccharide flippase family protein [Fimbriimonadaceae bacterium]